MTFFIDNCLSHKIAKLLHILGGTDDPVLHLTDEFPPDVKDTEWIPKVCAKKYVIVTSDREMNRSKAEADALRDNKAIAFFMPRPVAHIKIYQLAEFMCKCWPNVLTAAARAKPGDMFDVKFKNGKVELRPKK